MRQCIVESHSVLCSGNTEGYQPGLRGNRSHRPCNEQAIYCPTRKARGKVKVQASSPWHWAASGPGFEMEVRSTSDYAEAPPRSISRTRTMYHHKELAQEKRQDERLAHNYSGFDKKHQSLFCAEAKVEVDAW